jgi:hypothetical protein
MFHRTHEAVLGFFAAQARIWPQGYAHHSYPDFVSEQDGTIDGTTERIQFQNPHVLLTLRTADAILYTVEWQGATWLQNEPAVFVTPVHGSVKSDTLRVGDRIVVVGSPPRDPARHELVTVKEVRRPADEWLWTCRRIEAHHWC